MRLMLQAVYFVVIARALGAAQYGAFIGAVSLVAVVTPFSSWGTGFILIKNVVRDRIRFAHYWGTACCLTVVAGAVLTVLIMAVSSVVWRNTLPLKVLLLVGVSDIILVRILELSAQAFTAIEVLRKNSELYIVLGVSRTLAAGVFVAVVHARTAISWSLLYLLSALIAAAYSIVSVTRSFGLPTLNGRLSYEEFKEGFYFAVSQMSQTIYNDIDKAMLVRYSGLNATGIYGAAYRIVDACFAPVSALVHAAFPRFFRHGKRGISGSLRFARVLIACSAAYGLLAAGCLYAAAPVLPLVLGNGFASATLALRWLSPLVFIRSVHYFFADSLTGAGYQGLRSGIQLLVVAINVLLNLWLIPAYSWTGAAWASLASDSMLAVLLLVAIALLHRQARPRRVEVFESTGAM